MALSDSCLKSPPTSFLIKKAAGIDKAASNPLLETVATLKRDQVREIAQVKMSDMNAIDIEGAMRQVEGTARQMGIKVAELKRRAPLARDETQSRMKLKLWEGAHASADHEESTRMGKRYKDAALKSFDRSQNYPMDAMR